VAQVLRFYTDEHIAKAVSRGPRQRGVLTAAEAGMLGASDEEQLQRASQEARVLVTQNGDFLSLHPAGVQHLGIAYAPQGRSIGQIIQGLMLIYQALDADDMRNHVEFL
jgi:hypothetical protein